MMEIKRREEDGVTVLSFAGEFDAFNLPKISDGIDALVQKGRTRLVFNLAGLKFINSSALGYLIKTHKSLREYEGELTISEPSKFFQTTIATLGIDQIFKIFATDDAAVGYFHNEDSEEQHEFEGVPVDESLLGSTKISIRLMDNPDAMAVGKILSIYEDGLTFKYPYDADKVKIDPDDFQIGSKVWIKFRQPFLEQKRYFEAEGELTMAMDLDNDPANAVKFRVLYKKIDSKDEEALAAFVKDQDLLRKSAKSKDIN
jgi:anti-sigma B factor antagonist